MRCTFCVKVRHLFHMHTIGCHRRTDYHAVCKINYHYNFKVFNGKHTYYGGIPDIIQISEHQFMECQVIVMWMSLMDHWYVWPAGTPSLTDPIHQRTSATSCANFYNTSMAKGNEPPLDWSFGFTLSSDHVWSAFYLYCLLEDTMERHEYLVVKHTGNQKDCFTKLAQVHNQRMHTEGQPKLTYFCDKCTCWFYGPDN